MTRSTPKSPLPGSPSLTPADRRSGADGALCPAGVRRRASSLRSSPRSSIDTSSITPICSTDRLPIWCSTRWPRAAGPCANRHRIAGHRAGVRDPGVDCKPVHDFLDRTGPGLHAATNRWISPGRRGPLGGTAGLRPQPARSTRASLAGTALGGDRAGAPCAHGRVPGLPQVRPLRASGLVRRWPRSTDRIRSGV
jgi:hypothetical protein